MKLSDLTAEELDLVADELISRQVAIKRHMVARKDDITETRKKVLNITRKILCNKSSEIRNKAIEKRKQRNGVNDEN